MLLVMLLLTHCDSNSRSFIYRSVLVTLSLTRSLLYIAFLQGLF